MATFTTEFITRGKLTEFAGSEGDIVISHDAYVDNSLRLKGIGQKLHKKRINEARDLNKSLMICTVNEENLVQIHILEKFGWKLVHSFVSECSCHRIRIYVRAPWESTGMKED